MKKCNVENCENKHYCKNYCVKHYAKFRKYGDALFVIEKTNNRKRIEYGIWSCIKTRCYNVNSQDFKNYGGRGITVCDEWKNSFLAFYRDMGPRPSKDHSVDRIDNEKGYFKENCRWATKTEQARNRRKRVDNKSGYTGVSWDNDSKKWIVRININKKCKNLGRFKTIEQAIEERKKAELKYWK